MDQEVALLSGTGLACGEEKKEETIQVLQFRANHDEDDTRPSSLNSPNPTLSPPFAFLRPDEASVKIKEKANSEDKEKLTGDGVSWSPLRQTEQTQRSPDEDDAAMQAPVHCLHPIQPHQPRPTQPLMLNLESCSPVDESGVDENGMGRLLSGGIKTALHRQHLLTRQRIVRQPHLS
ncbi:hypothetical protein BLNAU_16397 [Blattamonas nauphoetae]|uniref:Uncharacterized protein n=1 Tax=Blattamonas nauphoetae TaxID=2049346 RepID=A0ABQ9XEC4_9EUKA|nr:hypothetical protein BLNAU_16397 [Blattamonas nauphoetae]